ncbi:restriction endonuclease [Streptomyces sp. NPDC046915]|uniref:restriction endonuclease n=1 Tax=Streptomyces sp. NPDC046915 TaxID=3155257 RepID=UPI0033F9D0DD
MSDGVIGYHGQGAGGCRGLGRTPADQRSVEVTGTPAAGDDDTPGREVPRSPGDARVGLISALLAFGEVIGVLVLLVGIFVSTAVWAVGAAVFIVSGSIHWLLRRTPAGRRNTARDERDAARYARMRARAAARAEQEQQAAAADVAERRAREAEQALRRAVRELLDALPARGTPQDEAIAHCLATTVEARNPRLQAEAERLARRHVAVDERILCVARSATEGLKERPALLILTDRGAAVSDKGVSYRFDPGPEDVIDAPEASWGELRAGELVFSFSRNPRLRVALAAREEAAAAAPSTAAAAAVRPVQRLIRDARDAELAAVDWMRYLGFTDAVATPVGADEGIDVLAEHAVAQVKKEGSPTSRPTVQQLHGVAAAKQRSALFFSMAGYTPPAIAWASQQGIALFQYDLQGTPQPVNPPALHLLEAADERASGTADAAAATPADTTGSTAAP